MPDQIFQPFLEQTRSGEIRVRDNGNGFPQKIIDKIFQPFYTTKPTGQARPNGSSGRRTGLGLSLAYDIVKAHGGDPDSYREKVETKEEGAQFIIQLPTV